VRWARHAEASLALLLLSCSGLVPQVWGQAPQPAPPRIAAAAPAVDVPRQLTLDTAEQLLVQQNHTMS